MSHIDWSLKIPKFCPDQNEKCGTFKEAVGPQLGTWKIDVPCERNSLFWSIALAFLIPSREDKVEFQTRFENIFSHKYDIKQMEKAMQCVSNYNPFNDRYSCYRNRTLDKLISKFEERTISYMFEEEHRNRFKDFPRIFELGYKGMVPDNGDGASSEPKIQAACFMLECNIAFISPTHKILKTFPLSKDKIAKKFNMTLILFESKKQNHCFQFGLDHNICTVFQVLAFVNILKMVGLYANKFKEIALKPQLKHSVIITLLKDREFNAIERLYSKPYIIKKLSQACYISDPTAEDPEGKSGFYYAARVRKSYRILHLLYRHASGTTEWQDFSPRNPNDRVLKNLTKLDKALQKAKNLHLSVNIPGLVSLQELSTFNNFQLNICEELFRKHQQLKTLDLSYFDNSSTISKSDEAKRVTEAEIRKQLIISILSAFEKYSKTDPSTAHCEQTDDEEELLYKRYHSYLKYTRYYQLLDLNAALLFFDNMFSLKQKLKLSDKKYEKIESSFFHYIYSYTYCDNTRLSDELLRILIKYEGKNIFPYGIRKLWQTVVLLRKLKIENNLRCFKDLLKGISVTYKNTHDCLQECDVQTLTSLPEIRDAFVLKRILHYLNLAITVDLKEDFEKGMLIIERALQVMGESLKRIPDSQRSHSSVTFAESLLVSNFPLKTQQHITKIRSLLSQLDQKKLVSRLEAEKDKDLFAGIQKELKLIRSNIHKLHDLQMLRERRYMIQNSINLLSQRLSLLRKCRDANTQESENLIEINKNFINIIRSNLPLLFDCPEKLSYPDVKDKLLLKEFILKQRKRDNVQQCSDLKKIMCVFQDLKSRLERSIAEITVELAHDYEKHIENHFHYLEKYFEEATELKKKEERKRENEAAKKRKNGEKIKLKKETVTMLEKEGAAKSNYEKKMESFKNNLNYHFRCILTLLEVILKDGGSYFRKKEAFSKQIKNMYLTVNSNCDNEKNRKEITENNIKKLRHVSGQIRRELNKFTSKNPSHSNLVDFNEITKLKDILSGVCYLTEGTKKKILSEVHDKFKKHNVARIGLMRSLMCSNLLPKTKAIEQIKKLILSEKKLKELQKNYKNPENREKNINILENIKHYYDELKDILDKNERIDKKKCDFFCENFKLSDAGKESLCKLIKGRAREERSKPIDFLLKRISLLEELLIKANKDIQSALSSDKFEKLMPYVKKQLVYYYINDPQLRATVEMLLFDCMNILKLRKGLKIMLFKSYRLFTGIDLRNVLGHGNPLLESVGKILDPSDLPTEFISKALELIIDRESLDAINELHLKTESNREDLIKRVELGKEHKDLIVKIKKCNKWKDYAQLIPPKETSKPNLTGKISSKE